ncbi:MAG: ISLre2 family transposase, partial [Planctomycetes bacterium]|nr:ISLre2 family transposase [Planctomycetota bacterium]
WNAASVQFPGCRQVLDVFHAPEHVGAAAKAMHGEGTDAAAVSFESGRAKVLADGWAGVCRYVGDELSREDTPARRAALHELIGYMKNHVGRMDYSSRLAEGRTIGSGLIEGRVKTVGLRLKARGARWVERNAEGMAALVGLSHGTLWEHYWSLQA